MVFLLQWSMIPVTSMIVRIFNHLLTCLSVIVSEGESNAKMLRSIALGELKLEETLEEASNAAKAAAGVRMSSLAELGSVQFKGLLKSLDFITFCAEYKPITLGPLLEKVRSSLLSIKSAVYGINTQAWQNALTDNQVQCALLLRNIFKSNNNY